MTQESSYRAILRSSSIMGSASVLNILAGLVKMKAAALLLGPAGVGLIGLYQNLMQTAATVSALGVGTVGTRQIAAAEDGVAVARVRRALFWGSLGLSLLGTLVFWLASGWIARYVLQDPGREGEVAWLSLGVGLTVAAGSQGALLTGLRRIGDFARIQVSSGILGAALGVLAIRMWGGDGLLAMVLVAPIVTFLAGHWYVSRLDRPEGPPARWREMAAEWRVMASLGFAFMLSGLAATVGQLAVRSLLQRELGAGALGQFQAAWSIGMTYLGFVLGAMGTDYYPRLAAVIADREAASRLVNEQTEVALLLCGPVLLAMLALAPVVIRLLYSAEFAPAADILRWQLLGDILKVMGWPLGFVLLAAGAGRTYILTEISSVSVFVAVTAFAVPLIGVMATGVAFFALYLWYLPLIFWLGRRRIGFRWSEAVIRQAVALAIAVALVSGLARVSNTLSASIGVPAALAFGFYGLGRLGQMTGLGGKIGWLAERSRQIVNWVGVKL